MSGTDVPRAHEAWMERVFDSLDIGVITIEHATGKVIRANEAYARMFGFTSVDEALGRSVIEQYADPKERKEIEARLLADESFRTTGVARIEARRLRHDTKEPIDIRMALYATFGDARQIVRMDVTVEDLGEKKQAQRAFRASEERFRVLFESSQVGMLLTDLNRRIQRVNAALCRFIGRSESELVGHDAREFVHPDNRPGFTDEQLRSGRTGRELSFLRADGQTVWAYVSLTALSDDDGAPHSLFGVVNDVTEAKRHEQAMLRLAKLESLGVLAGGIAHDFNNILAVIMGSVSLAAELTDVGPRSKELLHDAEVACERARELARQLVTFAKGGAPQKRAGWVGDVVREAAGFCLRGSNVAVEVTLPEAPWPAEFDPGQLNQVMHNLILNAQQAMPQGGTVRVTVTNEELEPSPARPLAAGRYVVIRVSDSGLGIPPENLERIFDPYFTTKATGTGLGLATTHSIVRRHGGHLAVSSTPGRGSTFEVYLPASLGRASLAAVSATAGSEAAVTTRVLVMDDEASVREIAAHILRAKGHEVDVVGDGEAAVLAYEAARKAGRPHGVVLLDLTIRGGLDGVDTIARLKSVDPSATVVVMTGYSPEIAEKRLKESGVTATLPKPFSAEALWTAVKKALRAAAP